MHVADAFAERNGRPPDGVWSAPGRINLIGEHTDYNDGFVLPLAIEQRTSVAVARRDDGMVRCWSRQAGGSADVAAADIAPGRHTGWSAYVLGVVWALRRRGVDVAGLDVVVDSDVPVGAGLSSSAALECAVALAAGELAGAHLEPLEVARACREAEAEVVGVPCGIMDQAVAVLARARHAVFLDCRTLAVEHVPLDLEGAGLRLLVVDTGVHHELVDGGYAERRRSCEQAARTLAVPALRDATLDDLSAAGERLGDVALRRARHVVTEDARVLGVVRRLRAGDIAGIGDTLVASHTSLRDDFEVSSPELDLAVEAAVDAGALGARMTGGGFGGSAIALVAAARAGDVAAAVTTAFARRGLPPPHVLDVAPGAAAARSA